ncbi:helicase C-terminal domain-containing protein [Escherichia coli]|uniref:helicase C-terminal domain-containing protein n=1 Tax=Escherichia coli TaxID=562 RepID=UPI003AAC2661
MQLPGKTFLNQFQSAPSQTLLGFCVLGGIFSEGIDLRGDRLIGVAIVSASVCRVSTLKRT